MSLISSDILLSGGIDEKLDLNSVRKINLRDLWTMASVKH